MRRTDLSVINNSLKWGVWLYFILLIFEGALRKWVLPGLATPLLVVRDPIAIWLIYTSWNKNLLTLNFFIISMAFVTFLSVCFSLIFGHGNLSVAIYGARILVIHFPLMFVIGKIFYREDVEKMGRILLLIAIPMAILIGLQFYSPQSAWVNRGVGGNMEGAGFSGAMGYFRPPGTFSFTIGNVMFFNFVSCFVLYFWITEAKINKLVLIGSTIALIASIPLSISRTLLFSVAIVLLFSLISVVSKPKFLLRMILSIIVLTLLILVLSETTIMQTSMGAFTNRFENASTGEGGVGSSLFNRFFGAMIDALVNTNDVPFFGYGIGMGTNVGAMLITGKAQFLFAEWEWLRIVGEMGFVLGVLIILIRFSFCSFIFFKSLKFLKKGDLLPWLLLGSGLVIIIQGQWAQPTILGFSTLIGGLILASSQSINNSFKLNQNKK